ncbi:MAG: hypothetical protein IPH05_00155 [Flavobacteriales bacterium]|nr:hypothetical protein [Flavobacteriales bacterium]
MSSSAADSATAPAEQHLIVRYLHALDAKVKRYIRTKRTLIARLQEQKQAIIQRAVTRGLDPGAPHRGEAQTQRRGVARRGAGALGGEEDLLRLRTFNQSKAHETLLNRTGSIYA